MLEPSSNVTPDKHFDMLSRFLLKQDEVHDKLEKLKTVEKKERGNCSSRKKIYVSNKMAKKGMKDV